MVKIFAGVALWAIYTFYYTDRTTADTWKYFDDGNVVFSALHDHPGDYFKMISGYDCDDPRLTQLYYSKMNCWDQQFDNGFFNDAHTMIRINAVIRIFSMGNYHTHSLFFSFLAFIGLCFIYRIFYPALQPCKKAGALIIFFLPSLVFWSSGVLKEGITLLATGGIIFHSLRFFDDKKLMRLPMIVLFSILLFLTKFYILIALVPALTGAWLVTKSPAGANLKFLLVLVFSGGIVLAFHWTGSEHDPLKLMARKQNNFLTYARGGTYMSNDSFQIFVSPENHSDVFKDFRGKIHVRTGANYMKWKTHPDFCDTVFIQNNSDTSGYKLMTDLPPAGSLMKDDYLQPSLSSFLRATPRALAHAVVRPWPWEGKSILMLPSVFENILLLVLLFTATFFFRPSPFPAMSGFCFAFSIVLLLLFGWTTPVLGALVRYRIMALPFLLLGLLMVIDKDKLIKKWKWLSKW